MTIMSIFLKPFYFLLNLIVPYFCFFFGPFFPYFTKENFTLFLRFFFIFSGWFFFGFNYFYPRAQEIPADVVSILSECKVQLEHTTQINNVLLETNKSLLQEIAVLKNSVSVANPVSPSLDPYIGASLFIGSIVVFLLFVYFSGGPKDPPSSSSIPSSGSNSWSTVSNSGSDLVAGLKDLDSKVVEILKKIDSSNDDVQYAIEFGRVVAPSQDKALDYFMNKTPDFKELVEIDKDNFIYFGTQTDKIKGVSDMIEEGGVVQLENLGKAKANILGMYEKFKVNSNNSSLKTKGEILSSFRDFKSNLMERSETNSVSIIKASKSLFEANTASMEDAANILESNTQLLEKNTELLEKTNKLIMELSSTFASHVSEETSSSLQNPEVEVVVSSMLSEMVDAVVESMSDYNS